MEPYEAYSILSIRVIGSFYAAHGDPGKAQALSGPDDAPVMGVDFTSYQKTSRW